MPKDLDWVQLLSVVCLSVIAAWDPKSFSNPRRVRSFSISGILPFFIRRIAKIYPKHMRGGLMTRFGSLVWIDCSQLPLVKWILIAHGGCVANSTVVSIIGEFRAWMVRSTYRLMLYRLHLLKFDAFAAVGHEL